MLLAGLLLAFFTIDLSKVYKVLPCQVAHLPTIKRANMHTVFVVFVTVKNRPKYDMFYQRNKKTIVNSCFIFTNRIKKDIFVTLKIVTRAWFTSINKRQNESAIL